MGTDRRPQPDGGPDAPADGPVTEDGRPDLPPGDGGVGAPCNPEGNDCQAGLLCCTECCLATAEPRCTVPDEDGECPLPDLFVDEDELAADVYVTSESFAVDDCAIVEGCVGGPGQRHLLRFSTMTPNVGTADLVLGETDPQNPNFEYSACHAHYHFVHYARYRLLDAQGNEVGQGRKQAFCLIDLAPYTQDAPALSQPFHCGNQGIHRGWADVYSSGLDCQWIDVTDVPEGDYILEVHVNPERVLPEKSYDNNATRIPVHIGPVEPAGDPLAPCQRNETGENRDCGWQIATSGTCTPGTTLSVGCDAAQGCGLGSCTGDTVLRVCAGDGACIAANALGSNDDACSGVGSCSFVTVECPPTGRYTVLTGPYFAGDTDAVCNVGVR